MRRSHIAKLLTDRGTQLTVDSFQPVSRFTYAGDDNLLLQEIQQLDAAINVGMLVHKVVAGFKFAAAVMDSNEQVDMEGVASNTQAQAAFQEVYDLLGAIYRHQHDDAGQHDLFSGQSKGDHYRAKWKDWYLQQVELLSSQASFIRLGALLLRNEAPTESPYAPEHSLLHVVYHQLVRGEMNISRRDYVAD